MESFSLESLLSSPTLLTWLVVNNPVRGSALLADLGCVAQGKGMRVSTLSPSHGPSGLAEFVEGELRIHGWTAADPFVGELVRLWRIENLLHRTPWDLSGGEYTLVMLVAKLSLRSELLIIDSVLDQLSQDRLAQVVRDLDAIAGRIGTRIVVLQKTIPTHSFGSTVFVEDSGEEELYPSLQVRCLPFERGQLCEVALDSVGFRYPNGNWALRNVSVSLKPASVYHLSGPNGCGKSTLASILYGHRKATSGSILVDQVIHNPYRFPGLLARGHLQNADDQLFETAVSKELRLASPVRFQELAMALGVEKQALMNPFDLPYPARKRLSVFFTLCAPSPWIILDEPTLGQSVSSVEAMQAAIKTCVDIGKGVVVISHDQEFTSRVATHEIVLH